MRFIALETELASSELDFNSTVDAPESSEERFAKLLVYSDNYNNEEAVEIENVQRITNAAVASNV